MKKKVKRKRKIRIDRPVNKGLSCKKKKKKISCTG